MAADPADHHLELAYVGLEVPEPESLSAFFGEVIGLVPGEPAPDPDTLTWRDDDRAHRLLVQPGPRNDLAFLGLEAGDDDAFDRLAAQLEAIGHPLAEGSADDRAGRRVARLG